MENQSEQINCHCGSDQTFQQCCEPILGGKEAPTAERLMRARFSAYVLKNIDFIQKTHDRRTMGQFDYSSTKEWAEQTRWSHLEIIKTELGGPDDNEGMVEFKAHFLSKKGEEFHHELSDFTKKGGAWFFTRGKSANSQQILHEEKPPGRNDPCHCGSDKKFKKCCINL